VEKFRLTECPIRWVTLFEMMKREGRCRRLTLPVLFDCLEVFVAAFVWKAQVQQVLKACNEMGVRTKLTAHSGKNSST